MAVDVCDQPAAQGIESSLRNLASDLWLNARCRREELRAEDIADRIALECAADASRIPVHILEAAVAIAGWRHADIGEHAGAPGLRQVLDPQPSFEERNLELEPQHDVKIVRHLVRIGADERALHLVDGTIKGIERD